MTNYIVSDTDLISVAAAIRAKGGTSAPLAFPVEFVSAIGAIPSGGGGEAAASNDVNFLDYDGTIVHSYTAAEFAVLTALPANPSHAGLTAQGWNWSLSDAKAYVADYGKLNIGQMYITDDGKTRIYIHLEEGRLSPYLGFNPKGSVEIDWGDGSAHDTVTGTSITTLKSIQHTYSAPGDYVIVLTVSGTMNILGTNSVGSRLLYKNAASANENIAYQSAVRSVAIGNGVTIGSYAFNSCIKLSNLTLPNDITDIGEYAFRVCRSLSSLTIPESVTSIGTYAFQNCYSLSSLAIPKSVTSIGSYTLANCSVLLSFTISENVTYIGSYAFSNCYSLSVIYFEGVTPPTVNGNAFTNLPTDCVIYVPSGSLSAYTSATNYPSSSKYAYIEY